MDNALPSWLKYICIGYVFVLGTTLMPLTIGGINYLLLAYSAMAIGLLLFLAARHVKLLANSAVLMMMFGIALSVLANAGTASVSSLLYTVFFIAGFIVLGPTTGSFLDAGQFSQLIKWLVIANAATMLAQQVCGIMGLPIININPEFTAEYVEALTFFRYNSLSSEPSYGSTIIAILFYLHYLLSGGAFKKEYWFYLLIVYLLVSFQSATGTLVFFCIVFLMLVQKSKLWWMLLAPGIVVLVSYFDSTRIGNLLSSFDITDPEGSLLQADLSASFRFVPNLLYIKQLDLLDWHFWLGHGYGFAAKTVGDFMPGIELEDRFAGGLLPSMLYDYGFVAVALFAWFSFEVCAIGNKFIFAVLWLAVCLNANLNTQLIWCLLTFFYWTKHCIGQGLPDSLNVKKAAA